MRVHFLLPFLASAEVPGEERIIGGAKINIAGSAFVAALLDCQPPGENMKCKMLCSGVLISPNVMLTAGHCIERYGDIPGHPVEATPIERMRVMVGGYDIADWRKAKTVRVKAKFNKGFGTSIRFPNDNDVGLVILDAELMQKAGEVSFLKISAEHDEIKCGSEIQVFGFGSGTNLEQDQLVRSNTNLKYGVEKVHSIHVCHQMYLQARMAEQITIRGQSATQLFKETILDDTYVCASGAESAVCYGDSGGPMIARQDNGQRVVVGVTAFNTLLDGKKMCGGGLDYFQRLSAHADWIFEKLTQWSCRPPEYSFAKWPPTKRPPSKKLTLTRCTGTDQWQCATGQCVEKKKHCDGINDCRDGSDEKYCKQAPSDAEKAGEIGGHIVNARINPSELRLCLRAGDRITWLAGKLQSSTSPKTADGDYDVSDLQNACRIFTQCSSRKWDKSVADVDRVCTAIENYISFNTQRKLARKHLVSKFPNECSLQQELDFDDLVSDTANPENVDWTAAVLTIVGLGLIALLILL